MADAFTHRIFFPDDDAPSGIMQGPHSTSYAALTVPNSIRDLFK